MLFKRDFMGDTETPFDVDLFLHGGNFVVIVLECFLNRSSLHNKIDLNSKHVIVFSLVYISLNYLVYFYFDLQIYPMISMLSVPAYYLFALIGYLLYLLSSLIFKILFFDKEVL